MSNNNSNILAIIPARGGSKRLLNKNILPIWDNPMLYWAYKACKNITDYVFVSTECDKVKEICRQYNLRYIDRPEELSGDDVLKQDVLIHSVNKIEQLYQFTFDYVISAQANSPELTTQMLKSGLEQFELYNDLQEVFTVDSNLKQHGAFRIFKRDRVFVKSMSYKSKAIINKCIDIHTEKDYNICSLNRHPEI